MYSMTGHAGLRYCMNGVALKFAPQPALLHVTPAKSAGGGKKEPRMAAPLFHFHVSH
jgi:hypothetical protein